MSRLPPEHDLLPSVLDRLIERDPRRADAGPGIAFGVEEVRLSDLKRSVRRDLEWLLNSRQQLVHLPRGLDALHDTLLSFGLPDFTHASLESDNDRNLLRRTIEQAIARFEPRLTDVVVTLVEASGFDRSLRYRIDAKLRVDPTPEPIHFDSVLKLPSKSFVVEGD